MVDYTAFQVLRKEKNHKARLAILYWQINGITACRGAAFLDDPLVAALDCWALGLQEVAYYKSEEMREILGDSHELVLSQLEGVHEEFQRKMMSVSRNPDLIRKRIETFAAEHPLRNLSYARESVAPEMARITGDADLSAFAAVGTLDSRIQDIAERLNVYAQQIPKQFLWSTALIREEIGQNEVVQTLVQDVHDMNASLERLSTLEDRLPRLIQDQVEVGMSGLTGELEPLKQEMDAQRQTLFANVAKEREAALAEVDRQRRDTLAFITSERGAIDGILDQKIETLTALVDTETRDIEEMMDRRQKEITAEVQSITAASVKQVGVLAEHLISQLIWGLLTVGAALLLLWFVLRFLSVRYLS